MKNRTIWLILVSNLSATLLITASLLIWSLLICTHTQIYTFLRRCTHTLLSYVKRELPATTHVSSSRHILLPTQRSRIQGQQFVRRSADKPQLRTKARSSYLSTLWCKTQFCKDEIDPNYLLTSKVIGNFFTAGLYSGFWFWKKQGAHCSLTFVLLSSGQTLQHNCNSLIT